MTKEANLKTCFVIAPIGEEGTEIRQRSDQILAHIIEPVAKDCGYEPVRADKISEPGIITSQVIQHLINDDLVIADLSDKNPNVFYELAVRHTVKKPLVQIIQSGESIPFDVAPTRTVHVDHRDLDSVANAKDELIKQIRSVEKDPSKVDSPISVAIDLQSLRQSENPLEKSNAEIISMLQDLRSMIMDIGAPSRRPRLHPGIIEEIFMTLNRTASALDLPEDKEPTREQFEQMQHYLYRTMERLEMLAIDSGLPPDMVRDLMQRIRRPRRRIK